MHPYIPFCLVLVCFTEQPPNCELGTFDPQACHIVDSGEDHKLAICSTDEAVGIIWLLNGVGVRLQFAIEEFIRILCKGTTMVLGVDLEDR
jgi:hypothetical protein